MGGQTLRMQLRDGLWDENPTLIQLLGMCPTLAITTTLQNGVGMGLCVTLVLMASNVLISLLRRVVPDTIRIAAYVVIIAGFVSMVDMLVKAYLPTLSQSLGLFIPLITVNCIILARAEAFASKNTVPRSLIDGLVMGLGFTAALCVVSSIREILGKGSLWGVDLTPGDMPSAALIAAPVGGFLVLGCVIALMQYIRQGKKKS